MVALSTFPSPGEITAILARSASPQEPATDLATLEGYYLEWPYPKSLDSWEGYIYADLCEQVGWAYFKLEEFEPALKAWRECPWPTTSVGERQAIAHILAEAYEDQSLVLAPPVGDLMVYGRIQLGTILASLDDPFSVISHIGSGGSYVVESRLTQPDGLYCLRFEFDLKTLFYVSFLPLEVHNRLQTARTFFQMGEYKDVASWLLRAAFAAQNAGLGPEAFSFLEKAQQFDPENSSVSISLTNLRVKGISSSLASRVVVERSLFQPDPIKRCEVRPDPLPTGDSIWLDYDWRGDIVAQAVQQDGEGRIYSLGAVALERAKELVAKAGDAAEGWPLLLPASWTVPKVDQELAAKKLSRVKALGLEELGVWKGDFRAVLDELMASWPEGESHNGGAEIINFALPKEVTLAIFSCAEAWQIPTLLDLNLPELASTQELAAWWRRLSKRWAATPYMLADDVIWFQMPTLPAEDRREAFLADLLNFSSDVAECFEPSMIRSLGPERPYLFPVPLQLTFAQ